METLSFSTAFTKAHHLSLFWATSFVNNVHKYLTLAMSRMPNLPFANVDESNNLVTTTMHSQHCTIADGQ